MTSDWFLQHCPGWQTVITKFLLGLLLSAGGERSADVSWCYCMARKSRSRALVSFTEESSHVMVCVLLAGTASPSRNVLTSVLPASPQSCCSLFAELWDFDLVYQKRKRSKSCLGCSSSMVVLAKVKDLLAPIPSPAHCMALLEWVTAFLNGWVGRKVLLPLRIIVCWRWVALKSMLRGICRLFHSVGAEGFWYPSYVNYGDYWGTRCVCVWERFLGNFSVKSLTWPHK